MPVLPTWSRTMIHSSSSFVLYLVSYILFQTPVSAYDFMLIPRSQWKRWTRYCRTVAPSLLAEAVLASAVCLGQHTESDHFAACWYWRSLVPARFKQRHPLEVEATPGFVDATTWTLEHGQMVMASAKPSMSRQNVI